MTEIRWIPSALASSFYSVWALVDGRPLLDAALADALAEPVAALKRELRPDHPAIGGLLSALIREAALPPDVLKTPNALYSWAPAVRDAFDRAVPGAAYELELRAEPLRGQWEARGPGLLHCVGKLTEPRLIVPAADVVLVHPVTGGGGRALRGSPSIAFEAVLANPIAELPEVVRLGWLLAQLNSDLDTVASGEEFPGKSVAKVGPLALLPAVLAAAEEVELIRSSEALLPRAMSAWHLGPIEPAVIATWWQRYQAQNPAWNAAVEELDRLLGPVA